MHSYDLIHDAFVASRSSTIGLAEVTRFVEGLPRGARVLDVGCGDGVPIARFLLDRGFALCAIDSSARMISAFRERFPSVPSEHGSVLDSLLFDRPFDAVIAWGVMFHLSETDQVRALARLTAALRPGGRLLFTSGREPGEISNPMHGVEFHYVSLGSARYREVLSGNGCPVVEEFLGGGDNYYYVARRSDA
jgi:SAM-dependent methyltransferase